VLRNPEAEQFFLARSARDEVGTALIESLKRLGEYEVRGELHVYKSPYAVTRDVVFCGAAGTSDTYWRLRPEDRQIAVACGAESTELGEEWVRVVLFRPNWPRPDLAHWALRAYDFARTGSEP
jgi:hypothetical protein